MTKEKSKQENKPNIERKHFLSFLNKIIFPKVDLKIFLLLLFSLGIPLILIPIDLILPANLQKYFPIENPWVYIFIFISSILFFGLLFLLLLHKIVKNIYRFRKRYPLDFEDKEVVEKTILKLITKRIGSLNDLYKLISIAVFFYYLVIFSYFSIMNIGIIVSEIQLIYLFVLCSFAFSYYVNFLYSLLLPFQNHFLLKYFPFLMFEGLTLFLLFQYLPFQDLELTIQDIFNALILLVTAFFTIFVTIYIHKKQKIKRETISYPFIGFRSYGLITFVMIISAILFLYLLISVSFTIRSITIINSTDLAIVIVILLFMTLFPLIPMAANRGFSLVSKIMLEVIRGWKLFFKYYEMPEEKPLNIIKKPMIKISGICIGFSYSHEAMDIDRHTQCFLLHWKDKENGNVIKIPVLRLKEDNSFKNSLKGAIQIGQPVTVFGRPVILFDNECKIKPVIEAFHIEQSYEITFEQFNKHWEQIADIIKNSEE